MSNLNVHGIINKALDGQLISGEEIAQLFSLPLFSEESFLVQCASRKMSESANEGYAEIHGQVGLNLAPCPKNCAFCSFAASNGIFKEHKVAPLEEIVEKCLAFEKAGANAVYLMATANFPFENFIRVGKAVRSNLQPETIMVANIGDFDYEQAVLLKEAGFSGVYHALRLGEGMVTAIKQEMRLKTFRAARDAGLLLGTCVEPVGPEHSVAELVEKTLITREAQPCYSGAARRIPIPNTQLSKYGIVSEAKMAHILAVVRLAMGYSVPGNCTHEPNVLGASAGANLIWAEMGSNPRDTEQETSVSRGFTVEKCKQIFAEAEWKILSGPSKIFSKK
ncbi:radical SAM protein [Zhaonella formicivorans]|uniref:radical SAM protein n=1 Tax=Zhaonella formicivorans TaxID=2528593 RepID=UPI0010DAFDD1|nr:radical SAM protein [Zhaonella formicivorans]